MAYNIFDFSHFWSNLKTLLNNKVDKVSGMGLSQNSFTNADKTKLDGIDAGATKTVVDAALSSTSTNPVQNKAVQAPIARLVDDGAKNIFDPTVIPQTATKNGVTITRTEKGIHVSGTVTATADTAIANNMGLVIPSDGYRVYINAASSDLTVWMEYKVNGSSVYAPATRDVLNSGYVLNYLYFKNLPGGASFDVDVDIMICTDEDYAVSPDFVPYAKSNYELTQSVEPIPRLVDAGAKNLLVNYNQSGTIYGISFVLEDGTISVSGTATGTPTTLTITPVLLPPGEYVFSGCPANGSDTTYNMCLFTAADGGNYSLDDDMIDRGTGFAFTLSKQMYVKPAIRLQNGYTVSNLVFKPMVCTAKDYIISQKFVPYTPTMRELYNDMMILSFDTSAFSSLLAYVDTLTRGTHSFLVPNNNSLTDVPMNNTNAIVTVKIYNSNTAVMDFVAISTTYQMYRYSKIKSAGTWRPWYKFEGTAVT